MIGSTSPLFCRGSKYIAFGWIGFITENLVLSHNREEIINAYGKDNYTLAYSTLSTATCSSIAWGLFRHGIGKSPFVAKRSGIALTTGLLLQTLGMVGLSQLMPPLQLPVVNVVPVSSSSKDSSGAAKEPPASSSSFALRCPIDFQRHKNEKGVDTIYGVERITRHPTLWALGVLGLGTAATTIFLPEVVFGSFAGIFAGIGSSHQDYRHRRGSGGYLSPERERQTSNLPFVALVSGRQSWSPLLDELKWTNAGLAVVTMIPIAMRQMKRVL